MLRLDVAATHLQLGIARMEGTFSFSASASLSHCVFGSDALKKAALGISSGRLLLRQGSVNLLFGRIRAVSARPCEAGRRREGSGAWPRVALACDPLLSARPLLKPSFSLRWRRLLNEDAEGPAKRFPFCGWFLARRAPPHG